MDLVQVNENMFLQHSTALALGNFDGVHLGHQQLITRAIAWARENETVSAVLTFTPHPLTILYPEKAPELLTGRNLKRKLIAGFEPDLLVEIPFTREFSRLSPHRFVEDILVSRLKAAAVFVGYNYTFGTGGSGNAEMLAELGKIYSFSVHVIPPVKVQSQVVSSSLIRDLLGQGKVELANRYLGHPYIIQGKVIGGEKLGRQIGFPTANLDLGEIEILLSAGVYAVSVRGANFCRPGVMNVGSCPTFAKKGTSVEVHLLDFAGDLYETTLEVEVLQRLRGEKTFADVGLLVEQIRRDVRQARKIFSGDHYLKSCQ